MTSGVTSSSFALVAFTSTLTLLISHLTVRQESHFTPQPSALLPSIRAPSTPTHTLGHSGASVVYMLLIMLLLFGLSGIWLEGRVMPTTHPHQRRQVSQGMNIRAKKKGYISSDEEMDDNENEVPGSWNGQSSRVEERKGSKVWKDKLKEKVNMWATQRGKSKQRAEDGSGYDAIKGVAANVQDERKTKAESECCGCCRVLLQRCEEKEAQREMNEQHEKKRQAEVERSEAEKKPGEREKNEEPKRSETHAEGASEVPRSSSSSGKEDVAAEKTSTPTTTNTSAATKHDRLSGSLKEQQPQDSTDDSQINVIETTSRARSEKESTKKHTTVDTASKEKSKATVVEGEEDIITEPPIPMPEAPGMSVEFLPEFCSSKANDKTVASEGESTAVSAQKTQQATQSDKGKDKGNSGDRSKGVEKKERKDGQTVDAVEKEKVEISEDTTHTAEKGSVGKGTSAGSAKGQTEGKIGKGLHVISDMTKMITEEVLKHVMQKLEGNLDSMEKEKLGSSSERENSGRVSKGERQEERSKREGSTSLDGSRQENDIGRKDVQSEKAGKPEKGTKDTAEEAGKEAEASEKGKNKAREDICAEEGGLPTTGETGEGSTRSKTEPKEDEAQTSKSQKKGKKKSAQVDEEVSTSSDKVNEDEASKICSSETRKEHSTVEIEVAVDKASPNGTKSTDVKQKGKGKLVEDSIVEKARLPCATESAQADARSTKRGLADIPSESAQRQALRDVKVGHDVYLDIASHLAKEYPTMVSDSSSRAMKALDDEFMARFRSQNIKISIPWYRDRDADCNGRPHQDGEESSPSTASTSKVTETREPRSRMKEKEDREAVQRALDLYKIYKNSAVEEQAKATSAYKEKREQREDADKVLQVLIEALIKAQHEEQETSLTASGIEGTETTPVDKDRRSMPSATPTKASAAFPTVIPLEAVNVKSRSAIAALNDQLRQQTSDKSVRIKDVVRSAASDARKGINLFLKDDLVDLRQGATSKGKTLRSLLKNKSSLGEEDKGRERSVSMHDHLNHDSPPPPPPPPLPHLDAKRRVRKSVRLQDAAGRGEGPRDEARGETEAEARFRRMQQMASRLND
ncbi:hypothetical protein CBS101457_003853 [Exobasidium rhododendri]|nr:hypothetical protein CBS101457_003853 [Exobasidium rhododendri]